MILCQTKTNLRGTPFQGGDAIPAELWADVPLINQRALLEQGLFVDTACLLYTSPSPRD